MDNHDDGLFAGFNQLVNTNEIVCYILFNTLTEINVCI